MPKKEAEALFSAAGKGWGDMLRVESYMMMSFVWLVGFLLLL